MKTPRGFFALSLLVAGLFAAAPASDGATGTTPATASPLVGNAAAGEDAFNAYCSICHGVGAKGFIGPKIGGINWTAPGLHTIVRGGLGGYGGMPAFNADAVTDQNIADIAAYLAALAPPLPVPQSTTAASPPPAPSPSPAVATNAEPDPVHGRQVYTANCAACHGANGQGGFGPDLRGEHARKDTAAAIAWIKNPQPPMPKLYPAILSERDVDDVAAYVESL